MHDFKRRLADGEQLIGTWVKTPSPILVEVLSLTALDCLCLDAEHAPFDRLTLDSCLLAARAAGKPVLVRTPSAAPEHILNALDCGADGIVLPHIRSVEDARAAARASHYGPGGRGYAGSSRAAGYTTRTMAEHRARARDIAVIAQIEDPEAVEEIEAIAAVDGIDALFVGRADLSVAYGADNQDDPRVVAAVERICAAGVANGRPVGMFLARPGDAPQWREKGASLFLLGSDHGFLLAGATALIAAAKGA
jgi:staphyloferrin B biosynthesis citrate synthase